MATFKYEAREAGGAAVSGTIEAESRKSALLLLSERGLFPSSLLSSSPEAGLGARLGAALGAERAAAPALPRGNGEALAAQPRGPLLRRISRKEITVFTREMASLLEATIPIPQALESLGEEEGNPALKDVILDLASRVRHGNSYSAALEAHPRLFNKLYSSMVRVGEEAGALQKVMADLAEVLEREDETRGEVLSAVAYPIFVLGFGVLTTVILLVFVFPRLFSMLSEMVEVLPLPTRILLEASGFFQAHLPWILAGAAGAVLGLRWYFRSDSGSLLLDSWKLRLPVVGPVFRASATSRFARTLGTLAKSGVSLLPALEIIRSTIGNRVVARSILGVAEDARGGDSLATPLRKLGLFPATVVQMIGVGEETGRLDEMLLKVAAMEERQMRSRTRTLISLLAPALILLVGALVGFMVIALLLPIFRMSQTIR